MSDFDRGYDNGIRQAALRVLSTALDLLGHERTFESFKLVKEREETILALRSLCDEFGDNDWSPQLHLAEIIEKHLIRHMV